MKNTAVFYCNLFFFSLRSCSQNGTISSLDEADPAELMAASNANQAIILSYFQKVWNEANLQVVEEVIPEPFILHFQGEPKVTNHIEHQELVRYWPVE